MASQDKVHPFHRLVRRARLSVKTKSTEHLWIFLKIKGVRDSGGIVLEEEE